MVICVIKTEKKFYVTTPIYYVTAAPHLGSLYSTVLADIIARWQKIQGRSVYFVTGTDEHGQKIALAAKSAQKNPKQFVDEFIPTYKHVWSQYEIEYQKFIRTTDSEHIAGVNHFIRLLIKNGSIYKDLYQGWYCTPCETFLTTTEISATCLEKNIPLCVSCKRPTEWLEESTYFFRLSAYQDRLLEFYKNNPHFIVPKERFNEVIRFVESGLKDLSISRTTVSWGVPFPDDAEHTVYVWAEALLNYLTVVGYADNSAQELFKECWPADVQVLGKDIVRFHAVYWPAFLMAAGLSLPQRLLVHGWIQVNKQKMSKSLGNVVDPVPLGSEFGVEQVRYFLARYIPINQDGDFTVDHLAHIIESDLANDLGNLVNRMSVLADKYDCKTVMPVKNWSERVKSLQKESECMVRTYCQYMKEYQFHLALAAVWKYIKVVNAYFHETEPWKIAKTDINAFAEIISATVHSLHAVAVLLWPVMPHKMEELITSLGYSMDFGAALIQDFESAVWNKKYVITIIKPLFEKPIMNKEQSVSERIEDNNSAIIKADQKEYISIEDLAKVELLVGTVIACEIVEKSNKLLRLQVDLGKKGSRTIFSGIRNYFTPSDLIGNQYVFVTNLKPRKMMDMISEGMMLCTQDDSGKPWPVTVSSSVQNGTPLK